MPFPRQLSVFSVAWYLLLVHTAAAENSVVVESKAFALGQASCTVGVFLTNDVGWTALVLPLEFRTLSGNAYMRLGTFSGKAANRLDASPLGREWYDERGWWPAPTITTSAIPYKCVDSPCSGPDDSTGGWCGTGANQPDFVSPDALFYASVANGDEAHGEPTTMLSGADPPGTSNASFKIIFNVNSNPGDIEIDSTCLSPASHLSYLEVDLQPSTPQFTKGLIHVGCECACQSDPECDGEPNIADIVLTVDRAFGGVLHAADIDCPNHFSGVDGRTDVNCSGATDIIDVVTMVDVVFRGADPAAQFCQPCL